MSISDPEKELEALLRTDPAFVVDRSRAMFDKVAGSHTGSIVLFGSGALGLRTLEGLRSLNIEPVAFADNNPNLWNRSVEGLKVLPPSEAVQRFGDRAVFVVTIYNGSVVRQQLKDMHCSMVAPFALLFWKYPEIFMPHCALDLPHRNYSEAESVKKALSLWADELSRREYIAQLRWRLLLDFDSLPAYRPAKEMYFPTDLISFRDDEVFVDCGAFDGDTLREILQRQGSRFKELIAIEPDPMNFAELEAYVSTLTGALRDKIILRRLATATCGGERRFDASAATTSRMNPDGAMKIQCASLDEIVSGHHPTYIKMDIEGAEYDTLMGARRTIKERSAGWAICVYHRQDDLWRIPLFINYLSGGYRFFLRRYAEECWEMVCYAIPVNRAKV